MLNILKKRLPFAFIVFVTVTALTIPSGCVSVADSGNKKPTVGQELIDLKAARDTGAISEEEYQDLRAKILDI